jgi:hypothetical protein
MMKEAAPMLKSKYIQGGAFSTYLLLKRPQDSMRVQRAIQSVIKNNAHAGDDGLQLTALPDIHLKANFGDSSSGTPGTQ